MLENRSQEALIFILDTLTQVKHLATHDFSGIGLVVYKDIKNIPMFPLQQQNFKTDPNNLVSDLLEISSYRSEYHDGFHFISDDFEMSHVAQYFSPPIISNANIDYSKALGGRFMAALFGSYVQGVLLTGILTRSNGIIIFEHGNTVYSKCWHKI
ncbi:hypothetical protein O4H50_18945 [Vibrio diazotrophicus]|uniref:hypothetical protein n=1 Tax=Vibrio diazotrophicus TaxID=685 RepID=UPI0022AF69B7|nr:hypothetical protein [Vibrio diazotrophicus]MCZ4373878.1 hypothetical protein [Vibrio diazotrophicus]